MTRTSFFIVMSCYCRDSVDNDGKYASSKNVYVKLLLHYRYRTLARTYSWNSSSLQETSHYLTSTNVDWHSCGINKLVFILYYFLFFFFFFTISVLKNCLTYFMRNMNSGNCDWGGLAAAAAAPPLLLYCTDTNYYYIPNDRFNSYLSLSRR